jgi:NAD(P)-dependent dehydrogenase (short-subunit alcohol dehydrogenase family)
MSQSNYVDPAAAAAHLLTRGRHSLPLPMKTRYAMIGLGRNNVAPGAIATPINEAWLHDPVRRKQVLELIPSRRIGQPEEVAGAVLYLVSDEAAYVTGTTTTSGARRNLRRREFTMWTWERAAVFGD